jgi:hypothetical protein
MQTGLLEGDGVGAGELAVGLGVGVLPGGPDDDCEPDGVGSGGWPGSDELADGLGSGLGLALGPVCATTVGPVLVTCVGPERGWSERPCEPGGAAVACLPPGDC